MIINYKNKIDNNNDHLPSMLLVDEEKYSNLKILDQKPIQYKDSPFESRRALRKNVDIEEGSSFNKNNKNDANFEMLKEKEDTSNKKKLNEMVNYLSEPIYNTNKNYKKLKTQPNVKPKMNFNNNTNKSKKIINSQNKDQIIQINKLDNHLIKENYPKEIIINDFNDINYNQISQQENYSQPLQQYQEKDNNNINLNQDYYNQKFCNNEQIRGQNRIQNRQKNFEENESKKIEDPRNTKTKKHHHKSRKIKVEIDKTQPNFHEFENPLEYFDNKNINNNNNNLNNASFSNKNIDTKYYNKYNGKIDPKIFNQFILIKEMENNQRIKELEIQREELKKDNMILNKNATNLAKEREKLEQEKRLFLESKARVINDSRKNEERLIKLENELQDKFMKKKNEILEMRNKLKEEHNNLENERFNMRNIFQTKLNQLESDYKIKEETQNYNNNLNIDNAKKEQEKLRQKEKEINDLQTNFLQIENNLKTKENELISKEKDLKNREYDLNNKFQDLIQKEQKLQDEKDRFLNTTKENQNNFNMRAQELKNREEQLINKENHLIKIESQLKDKEYEIKNKEEIVNNQENELNNRQNELNNKKNELHIQQTELYNQQNILSHKERLLDILNKEIQDKENQIIELNNRYNNMISNMNSPNKKNENLSYKQIIEINKKRMNGPMDTQVETRTSISIKRIQRKFNEKKSENIPEKKNKKMTNDLMNFDKVETFGESKESKNYKNIKENDDFSENNLDDIKGNDDFPENNLNDIKDNDDFPDNNLNDIKDNDNFPEKNLDQDNDTFPYNIEDNNMNNIMDNNNGKSMNNNIDNNLNNINMDNINKFQSKNQLDNDKRFYCENPYEIQNQSNENNSDNRKMKNEEIDDENEDDFAQFINNQSNGRQISNNNENSGQPNHNNNKRMGNIIPFEGNLPLKEGISDLDLNNKNSTNDIMRNHFPDTKIKLNNKNLNQDLKKSEENFSLDLSSKNKNLPDFQEINNNNLDKQKPNHMINSQGIKKSNNNNDIENSNNFESGEINLNNLNHEEEVDYYENYNNNKNNLEIQKENEKDKEINEIIEELYIEEYNPSLGLTKIENPKYLNSVIQCFAHIPAITNKIINLHNDQNFKNNLQNIKLTQRYRNLLINIFFPEKVYNMNKEPYNPLIFMNTLYDLNPLFQNKESIELKEFIDYLIPKLHDDLNTKKNTINNSDTNLENINKNVQIKNENDVLVDFLQNFTTKNNSIISKNLYGIIKYTFYCHQCQKTFFNFQCYSYLYFNLNKVIEYKQNRFNREDTELNLEDCLDFNQKAETLRGDKGLFCPSCKEQTESTSIKNIYSTKNAIIFILDRNIGLNFNQCNIEFKENINLKDYVQYKKEGEKTKEKFFLGGVVNFIPDNHRFNAYCAFIKMGKNNDWYSYNNENVYPVSFKDIKNKGYPIALFYQKILPK